MAKRKVLIQQHRPILDQDVFRVLKKEGLEDARVISTETTVTNFGYKGIFIIEILEENGKA
jgi:hypothetical protein